MGNSEVEKVVEEKVMETGSKLNSQAWKEEGGLIHIPISSGNFSVLDWDNFCELNQVKLDEEVKTYIKKFFNSGGKNDYDHVVILRSPDSKEIRDVADKATELNLVDLSVSDLLFMRMKLADKDIQAMGLWWLATLDNPMDDKVLIIDAIGGCLVRLIKLTDLQNLTNKHDGFAFGIRSGVAVYDVKVSS